MTRQRIDGLWAALGSSFGARLVMAALNYGLFWELSRRLGAAELGGFSVLMNLFFMVQGLPLLGLSAPLARRAATLPAQLPQEVSNAFAFALPVASLLGLAVAVVGGRGYDPALQPAFWLLGAAIVPTAWTLVAETALLGRERMTVVARTQCLESLGRAVGAITAVELGHGLTGVFAVFLLLRGVIALVYAAHPDVPRIRRASLSRALWRRNWGEVPVFLGIALATGVAGRVDVLALSQGAGLAAAGVYAAAARLYEATLMLPTIAAMVMLPALARLFATDRDAFRDMLTRALHLSLGAGFAVALAVAALADPLIGALYPAALHDAGPVLRVLIFGAVLMTSDQLLSSTMTAAQAQAHDLRTMLLALGVLGLGLSVLVPWLGPLGAAVAVVTSLVVRVAWRLRWLQRTVAPAGLGADLLRLAAAWACGLAGLLAGLRAGPAPALIAAGLAYAAGLRATGLLPSLSPIVLRDRWRWRHGEHRP